MVGDWHAIDKKPGNARLWMSSSGEALMGYIMP